MTTDELFIYAFDEQTEYAPTTLHQFVHVVNTISAIKRTDITHSKLEHMFAIRKIAKTLSTAATRRNKKLALLLRESYNMFNALNEHDIYLKYIIWWSFNIYQDKYINSYTPMDVLNDTLLSQFKVWFDVYSTHLAVLNAFFKSCDFVAYACLASRKSSMSVIRDLITTDKLAAAYMMGDISDYAIAAIPESVMRILATKHALFSSQLLTTINNNKEYLLGKLNAACANIIKTPVNFIAYVDQIHIHKIRV